MPDRPEPPSPTPAAVALHPTASRRRILEVLRDCGPRTDAEIAECWMDGDGSADRWEGRLPGLVGRSTWKLEFLGWIDADGDRWKLTSIGSAALAAKA